ncbi:lipoxygenase homology domain-containing protein 1-like [Panicum miliaceum]|uniref:Lipoxygenase homology domain-containing protein 1-like n=1 Tax=Panicum miliaceum TaxID=4540 RepID=A0A3L6RKL8_PANMI|nr:lipoxygenase homology domain-containing protein 1-like [Panicum miliaceum]
MKIFIVVILITLIAVSASHAFALSLQGEGEARPDHPSIAAAGTSSPANLCLYEIVVKTAPGIENGGTDARIYLKLSGADERDAMEFPDLESWGWMGPGHDYFESGNMDIFGQAPRACMAAMPCRMLLASDGSSGRPDWYVNFVEVIQIDTGLSVLVRKFFINGWLSASMPPYQLFAYQDLCGSNNTEVA